jgi:hypothetical protein
MSRGKSIRVCSVLRAVRSAGVQVRKVYVYPKELQLVVAGGMTLVYRV